MLSSRKTMTLSLQALTQSPQPVQTSVNSGSATLPGGRRGVTCSCLRPNRKCRRDKFASDFADRMPTRTLARWRARWTHQHLVNPDGKPKATHKRNREKRKEDHGKKQEKHCFLGFAPGIICRWIGHANPLIGLCLMRLAIVKKSYKESPYVLIRILTQFLHRRFLCCRFPTPFPSPKTR